MTVKELKKDIDELKENIQEEFGDEESWHMSEDLLKDEVLEAIATGDTDNPRKLAEEALKLNKLKYQRFMSEEV